MFKFSFTEGDTDIPEDMVTNIVNVQSKGIDSKELIANEFVPDFNTLNECKVNELKCENITIKYISSLEIVINLINNHESNAKSVLNAEAENSDLLTGVYEGGLKIWECTYDLINFINTKSFGFSNKNVLDLGCGAGIVGIFCLLNNAHCTFQDYNEEVIKYVTIPNVTLNINTNNRTDMVLYPCKFFSGDWESFTQLLNDYHEDEKFDYIFASEIIYNSNNYLKILNLFKNLLKKTGFVYLAAKSYYFGVGGGISDFVDLLEKQEIFTISSCWKFDSGVNREILKICYK